MSLADRIFQPLADALVPVALWLYDRTGITARADRDVCRWANQTGDDE